MNTRDKEAISAKQLIEALFKGTLDDMVNVAESLLGNPVFIRDNSHRVLAVSKTRFPDCKLLTDIQDTGYLSQEMIAGLKKNRRIYSEDTTLAKPMLVNFDPSFPDLITMPVFINNVVVCYVSAIQIGRSFVPDDFDMLVLISKAVSVELQKNDLYKRNLGLLHESFLVDILERDMNSDRSRIVIDKRIKSLNLSFKENLFLSAYRFNPNSEHSYQIRTIAKELRHILPGSIGCIQQNTIIFLTSSAEDVPYTDETRQNLEVFLESYDMVAAFTSAYRDICHSHQQFTLLTQSLDIGIALHPKKRIQHIHDLLVYQMFKVCNQSMPLIEYVSPRMLKLRDYDRKNNSELFTTLYYYLINQKNTNAVSTKLNIHRNTLFYRLARINEITAFDLNDEEVVFQLLLAFKLLEYSALETGKKLCFKLENDE